MSSGILKKEWEELTDAERNYLEKNLVKLDAGDVTRLHRLALYLLAGLPLEKFAGPLFSSAFSGSLTPTTGSPYREFEHLIRFNYVDWFATRRAFLKLIEVIGEERSSVGDWAVVKTLRRHRRFIRCSRSTPLDGGADRASRTTLRSAAH